MGQLGIFDAPGLQRRKGKGAGGADTTYWIARRELVKQGYKPACVRVTGSEEEIASYCRLLQAEMLAWSAQRNPLLNRSFNGTFKSLFRLYQTDPDSSFNDKIKPRTRENYAYSLSALEDVIGSCQVERTTGSDTWRWYKMIAARTSPNYARYMITAPLKAALHYGVANRVRGCPELSTAMSAIKFPMGGKRQSKLTYDQIEAFCEHAHDLKRHSMALGLSLQFHLMLRQRDVIGEWLEDRDNKISGIDNVRNGRWVWNDGLTWAHIDAQGILRKVTSKTQAPVVHDMGKHPTLLIELDLVPLSRRNGPLVINEATGLPYERRQYSDAFRLIARKAGIADTIWSMDARAGAVTEALEAGADPYDTMATTTHTSLKMLMHYNRDNAEKTSRVAKARQEGRRRKG